MKRLIRKAYHSYNTRDEALLYIDGQITIGNNHPEMINEYLSDHTDVHNKLIEEYKNTNGADIPESEIAWETVIQISEHERAEANFKSIDDIGLVFGHIVYDEVNNETDEEYDIAIYLETVSMTNVSKDEVVSAIKKCFSPMEVKIFNDNSYELEGGRANDYEEI